MENQYFVSFQRFVWLPNIYVVTVYDSSQFKLRTISSDEIGKWHWNGKLTIHLHYL